MTATPQTAQPAHRILVTGSRDWTDRAAIADAIAEHLTVSPEPDAYGLAAIDWEGHTIVHGDAPGADTIAARLAVAWGMEIEPHPAYWQQLGRGAGPRRNTEMVAAGADVCLTFATSTGSRGTLDCARKARAAGIPVHDYGVSTEEPT